MSDPNAPEIHEEDFGEAFGQPATGQQQENQGEQQHGGEDQFFEGGNEGHHDQGFGEDQGYQAHNFEGGDFGGHDQGHDQGHTEQQHSGQAGGDQYDDFFTAQPTGPGASTQQAFGVPQGISPGLGQGGMGGMGGMPGYGDNYDPEEEERLERLRRIEQERNQMLDNKAREERESKQEKIAEAAKELSKWHSEREQNNEKRRQINRQNQEIKNETNTEEEYKGSWDKVVGNIATKEGEYPGSKDVARFRQSLINKKADEAKGTVQKVAEY